MVAGCSGMGLRLCVRRLASLMSEQLRLGLGEQPCESLAPDRIARFGELAPEAGYVLPGDELLHWAASDRQTPNASRRLYTSEERAVFETEH